MCFRVIRIIGNALHRANLHALWRIKMTDAFGAFHWVNLVILHALCNRFVGAFRLAYIAVDALFGDLERQRRYPSSSKRLRMAS